MTREEAIEVLKDIYNYTRFDTYTTNEARTMAIEALEKEPKEMSDKKCEDCTEWEYFEGYGYGCFCMKTMTPIDANKCKFYVDKRHNVLQKVEPKEAEIKPPCGVKELLAERKRTNQQMLATISAEEFYDKIMWLLHDYGKRYSNSRLAITEWLNSEVEE